MLITFKSKAAADLLMYHQHAEPILYLLVKLSDRGVIAADEMSDAILKLEAEIAIQKSAHVTKPDTEDEHVNHDQALQSVGFSVRAFPLLEMMRAAKRDQSLIMWGV
jgi:hypothetical protein